MLYRILGTLAVGSDDQRLRLPGGRARDVLAALLIRANRPISATELMRVAWGDADVPRLQLDKRIVEVRTLLTAVGRRDRLHTVRRLGYELRAHEDELDALRFERLTLRADEAKAAGRREDEVAALTAALDLWRGPRVASNTDNDRLALLGRSLEARRRRAAVRLFELEYSSGRYDSALARVAGPAADYPTDQRLCELLMLAHHRCGDDAGANRAYLAHQRALDEELGATPDKATRDLHFAIAGGDEPHIRRFESTLSGAVAQRSVVLSRPRELPPPPADFVGRGDSVAEAVWLLSRQQRPAAPVIVVTGPPGAGKTTLAQQVAHQVIDFYPDGQLVADLRGSAERPANPDEILAAFLRSLGVTAIPEASADRVGLYRTSVADRRVLLVLDDAYDEEQVRDLIPGGSGCAVIVTARRKLPDIDGVHHLPAVGALDDDEAVELFLAVLRRSRIEPLPDPSDVAQVVAVCGGLPLALRVAAAQYAQDHPRPLADLVKRLKHHGVEAMQYGSRSLTRSVAAGFERLDRPAQRLLLGLGLTRLIEFELWTAAALVADADPVDSLSVLADYHMVEPLDVGRYRLHDLTRDYVARRAQSSLPEAVQARMAGEAYAAILGLARMAHTHLVGGPFEVVHSAVPDWLAPQPVTVPHDQDSAWQWFERERTNIRSVVEHSAEIGLTDICWDLAFTAHEFYAFARYFDDWYSTQLIALEACQAAQDHRGEALMLVGLGQPALVASRPASGVSGLPQLAHAVRLLSSSDDRHGLAIAERTLGNALRRRGQLAAPLELFTRALQNYESSGDMLGRWQTLRFIGHTYLDKGDIPAALEYFARAQAAAEALGRVYPLAQTSYWKGQAHLAAGDAAGAAAAFRALFDTFDESSTDTGRGYALHAHGQLCLANGEPAAALAHLLRAADLAAVVADASLEGYVHASLATAYARLGREGDQLAALERAAQCFGSGDAVYLEAAALTALAEARTRAGDVQGAGAARRRAERLYAQMNLPAGDRVRRGLPA